MIDKTPNNYSFAIIENQSTILIGILKFYRQDEKIGYRLRAYAILLVSRMSDQAVR